MTKIQRVLLHTPGSSFEPTFGWKVDADHPPLEVGDVVETPHMPTEQLEPVTPLVTRVVTSLESDYVGAVKLVTRRAQVDLTMEPVRAKVLMKLAMSLIKLDDAKHSLSPTVRDTLTALVAELSTHPAIDA